MVTYRTLIGARENVEAGKQKQFIYRIRPRMNCNHLKFRTLREADATVFLSLKPFPGWSWQETDSAGGKRVCVLLQRSKLTPAASCKERRAVFLMAPAFLDKSLSYLLGNSRDKPQFRAVTDKMYLK